MKTMSEVTSMTIEEAIYTLEDGLWWDFVDIPFDTNTHNEFHEALEMAITALRAQQEEERKEPLTLDELREMDGEPVYVVTTSWYGWPCWAIVNSGDGRCETRDLSFMFSEIDQLWTAYPRPPKEKENE